MYCSQCFQCLEQMILARSVVEHSAIQRADVHLPFLLAR